MKRLNKLWSVSLRGPCSRNYISIEILLELDFRVRYMGYSNLLLSQKTSESLYACDRSFLNSVAHAKYSHDAFKNHFFLFFQTDRWSRLREYTRCYGNYCLQMRISPDYCLETESNSFTVAKFSIDQINERWTRQRCSVGTLCVIYESMLIISSCNEPRN